MPVREGTQPLRLESTSSVSPSLRNITTTNNGIDGTPCPLEVPNWQARIETKAPTLNREDPAEKHRSVPNALSGENHGRLIREPLEAAVRTSGDKDQGLFAGSQLTLPTIPIPVQELKANR